MRTRVQFGNAVLTAALLLLCATAAWTVSQLGWGHAQRVWLPFVFLILVLLLGARYGRTVGMLGTIVAALIFAHSLYLPTGSLAIKDQSARQILAWTVLLGVSTSFLLLPTNTEKHR